MIFDNRTTGFLSALIPMILGALMYFYSRERKVYGGFYYWVIAIFLVGVGFLLLVLREIIPDLISIVAANLLILYAAILVHQGFLVFFNNKPSVDYWNLVLLGMYLLGISFFTYASPNINTRILLVCLATIIINLRIGVLLYFKAPRRLLDTARAASLNAFLLAAVSGVRGALTLRMREPVNLFLDPAVFWYSLIFIAGMIIWAFSFFVMNSARVELELEDARQELVKIANTDSLTGIGNRRWFFENAANEFQRASRSGRGLACLMMDIDGFKQVNDRHGHAAGDSVLQHIGASLNAKVRPFDLVARLGGDEFVLLITEVKQKQAERIAERMRKVIERQPVQHEDASLPVRVSMGLSLFKPEDENFYEVLKRADSAMYRAKKQKRHAIVVV